MGERRAGASSYLGLVAENGASVFILWIVQASIVDGDDDDDAGSASGEGRETAAGDSWTRWGGAEELGAPVKF
jgi:hypothetical protein